MFQEKSPHVVIEEGGELWLTKKKRMEQKKKSSCGENEEGKMELILAYLPPSDLASLSLTCKTLLRISNSITISRASDASRGLERHPIPFINHVDRQPYSYFLYTPFSLLPSSVPSSQPWGFNPQTLPRPISDFTCFRAFSLDFASGCGCRGSCSFGDGWSCPCFGPLGRGSGVELWGECGADCACGIDCGNRKTQGGVSVKVKIVKDRAKGWGLFAAQFIRKDEFVCEYAGELLTIEEAKGRQRIYDEVMSKNKNWVSSLLVVREHLPSGKACLRINIDASRVGNVARFINHSCDGGNLSTFLVRNSGALVPRLCFLAARDILDGEELCFSYGEVCLRPKGQPCFCGTSSCFGVLPSEPT